MKKSTLILFALLLSCAHHKDVRPGANGTHEVQFKVKNEGEGSQNAMAQAKHFCEQRYNQYPAFVSENTKYIGNIDEDIYKTTKTISDVAKTVGGAIFAMGEGSTSKTGGQVGIGGQSIDTATGLGYMYSMKFTCQ